MALLKKKGTFDSLEIAIKMDRANISKQLLFQ